MPLAVLATRAGLRQRQYLLAAATRLAARRRLGGAASAAARPPRLTGADRLVAGGTGFGQYSGGKRGEQTGPNPTDRGRPGTKHHLLVDRTGIPLAVLISPASWHDSRLLEPLLDAVWPIKGLWGRPRKRPATLHGDKGY